VVALTIERHGSLLSTGAVLIDDTDPTEVPRVLCYLEHTITDARPGQGGRDHVVSRRFEFVSVDRDGNGSPGRYAPYLDYRPATPDELVTCKPVLGEDWFSGPGLERRALGYAIGHIVPAHLAEVAARTDERAERTITAVRTRLTREINYWDQRAAVLKEQAAAGRQPKMNPEHAQARADEFVARMRRRLGEVDADGQLLLIEVKGRVEGSTTVTVTRNEILTGLNVADRYLLALVVVRTDGTCQVRYLRDPFAGKSRHLHFAERSTTFDWDKLWETAETPR